LKNIDKDKTKKYSYNVSKGEFPKKILTEKELST